MRAWELLRFGRATKVTTRRSVAGKPHSRALRAEAKLALAREPVTFTGHQAIAIADGFGDWAANSGATILACAILPEHAHLVVARHRFPIEQVANLLKGQATKSLTKAGLHSSQMQSYRDGTLPSPWARKFWKVFLTADEDILRAIRYVENNPFKEGKRRQRWGFVVPW